MLGEPRVLTGAFLDCFWSLSGDLTSAASPAMHAELGHGDLVLLLPLRGPAAAGAQALCGSTSCTALHRTATPLSLHTNKCCCKRNIAARSVAKAVC